MDSFLLKISRDSISKLKGFYVSGLKSISTHTIEVILARSGKKAGLVISVNPSCPRIYPVSDPIEASPALEGAPKLIKKKLMRKKLQGANLPPFERVIELIFDGGVKLIHELLGRFSTLYLVEDGNIVCHLGKKRKGLGSTYGPPEKGLTPLDITEENFQDSIGLLSGLPRNILERIRSYTDLKRIVELYNAGIHPEMGRVNLEEMYLKQTQEELRERERELEKQREKRIKKLRKILKKLEMEKKNLEEKLKAKKLADLLAIHLSKIKKGETGVQLEDPETGKTFYVELDPFISPSENLQHLYRTYKKAKSGLENLEKRILRIKEEIKMESKMPIVVERRAVSEEGKGKKHGGMPVRKLKSPSGFTVYVGLNSRGNEMVRKLGSPNDLWFHLKDMKGPHAVMKLGGKTPKEEDISFTASLVLGGRKGKLLVDYTELKFVKKPPGSPPGFVTYRNHKTVVVDGG